MLGDSHLAALKWGWEEIAEKFPLYEVTWFAGPGPEWTTVEPRDGKLVAASAALRDSWRRSSEGADAVPADFDAYILHGLGASVSRIISRWPREQGGDISAEWLTALSRSALGGVRAFALAKAVRSLTKAEIVVVPTPFRPKPFFDEVPRLDAETWEAVARVFNDVSSEIVTGIPAHFIAQSPETVGNPPVTTKARYRSDRHDDRFHANGEFGKIVMRNAMAHLRNRQGRARP
jgi:hypothetical protein